MAMLFGLEDLGVSMALKKVYQERREVETLGMREVGRVTK